MYTSTSSLWRTLSTLAAAPRPSSRPCRRRSPQVCSLPRLSSRPTPRGTASGPTVHIPLLRHSRCSNPIFLLVVGFVIPDAFVVGYSLDYNEAFRDLDVRYSFPLSRASTHVLLAALVHSQRGRSSSICLRLINQSYHYISLVVQSYNAKPNKLVTSHFRCLEVLNVQMSRLTSGGDALNAEARRKRQEYEDNEAPPPKMPRTDADVPAVSGKDGRVPAFLSKLYRCALDGVAAESACSHSAG